MITGLAHAGVCVPDCDAAVAYYRDVLGFTVLSPPYVMDGDAIRADMGELLADPAMKAAIVGFGDDGDRVLEVIEYLRADGSDARREGLADRGLSHVGLICEDLDETRKALENKGVRFLVDGIADIAGVRTTWFADPWGVVFILVEKGRPERPYFASSASPRVALIRLPFTVSAMAIGGVLFDIDGVLVTSWKPIAGAAETLQVMVRNQIACSYLTNTTTRTRVQIAELLAEAGMPVRADEVITAAVLTAEYVRNRYADARCFLVNSGQIAEDMPGIDIVYSSEFTGPKAPQTPDVVLLGGAGPEYSHLTLSWVYDWMAQGVPVVAMHRSTAWTTTDGLRVDTGMYLIGMEETSGRKATAVGKPAPEGFLAAASRLGVDPDEMYMIGDDLNNDVLAAQVVGMTGVLVRTGKFRQDTLDRWAADEFAMQPNHVIDSVADLPALLEI